MNPNSAVACMLPFSPERAIARALLDAKRPLLVLGYGAVLATAHDAIARIVHLLPHLHVAATPKAKGAFPERDSRYLGVIGFAGHDNANRFLFESADFVLLVGTRLGELTSNNWDVRWKRLESARIDVVDDALCSWCRSRFVVKSDARFALDRIAHHVRTSTRVVTAPPVTAPSMHCSSWDEPLLTDDVALTPKVVFQLLNRVFPSDGHVFSGIGNTMAWGIHYLRRQVSNRWHVNLAAGAMGHAIPAALGGALTGAQVAAVVGDAEFLMTGYEVHTAVENRLPITIIVLNDGGHGMVRIGSQVHCGAQTPSCDFETAVDLVGACHAQGAHASRPSNVGELTREIAASLKRPGPTVLDVAIARDQFPPLGARLSALTQAFGKRTPCEDIHDD